MSKFNEHIKKQKGAAQASTISTNDLESELQHRESSNNVFPLHVFHDNMKPYIEALVKEFDIPRSFVGLCLLSSYSTAIGTKYVIQTNKLSKKIYLPLWGGMVGISSSGKSMCLDLVYDPLYKIQNEYNLQWDKLTEGMNDKDMNSEILKTVIYRDSHVPTLIKSILPDNPKGVCKVSDEILEWINGMNQLNKKEGTDEQFWLSGWNCASYSAIRASKNKTNLPRPFTNVIGGTQYKLLSKIFANNRDSTGFIQRLLFALTDSDKIAQPNPRFELKKEIIITHEMCINELYYGLNVVTAKDEPYKCVLTEESINFYEIWCNEKAKQINLIEDRNERDTQSSIYGKIKEYVLRFCAILHLSDRVLSSVVLNGNYIVSFSSIENIQSSVMKRAIELGDYFFQSAIDVNNMVQKTTIAPEIVIQASNLFKKGWKKIDIAKAIYTKAVLNKLSYDALGKKIARDLDVWRKEYPNQFGANTKR